MGKKPHSSWNHDYEAKAVQLSVTSIYFLNGSTVDIIETEGSPSFKEMMRATTLHATVDHALLDDALKPGTGAAQAPLFW